jgi:predicted AAA+ superfamily ATPase
MVRQAARHFPAVVVTGPRRSGKTTLLRQLFPKIHYVLLEDPDIQGRIRSDPRTFLEELRPPILFDEIQNAPELLSYVRTLIDTAPSRMGQWLFTGSQEAPLMQGITESMAGRAAILQLLPFSVTETPKVNMLHGGFPEVVVRPKSRALWFASYLQTYLERDVRSITNVRDLVTFRRFIALLASRHGQILNKTDLAAPLGVSAPTISEWLHVLEITSQIIIVPPYFENLGKRLVKTPKVYWGDSGLACYLLGITSEAELQRSPFLGQLYEGFVAAEILKSQVNQGGRKELYYFRDHQGLEVDFLLPRPNAGLWLIECKAGKTVRPAMAAPLLALRRTMEKRSTRLIVVYGKSRSAQATRAVARGVEAIELERFVASLTAGR